MKDTLKPQEAYVILDTRGCVMHSMFSGKDADATVDFNGRSVPTPGHALDVFVDRYFKPITRNFAPREIIAVWDGGNAYRKSLFPEYKAHRGKDTSDELKEATRDACDTVAKFLDAMGITQVQVAGVEADDVIAYLVQKLPGAKMVHTVDADLIQLSTSSCSVWLKGVPVDAYKVSDTLAVAPHLVPLYKALCGDTSDGYKGVPGFGPKAFESLLSAFGEDGVYELDEAFRAGAFEVIDQALATQPQAALQKVKDSLAQARSCYNLATLWPSLAERDPNTGFNRISWRKRRPCTEKVQQVLVDAGCEYLMPDLLPMLPQRWILDARGWSPETDLAEAAKLFGESPFVAIDLETWAPDHPEFLEAAHGSFVDVLSSKITGMGMTFGRNLQYTFYATVGHADSANLPKETLLELLGAIPEGVPVVCHNSSFERTVILNDLGADLTGLHDTQLMAAHIEETESRGLKDLAKRWLDYSQTRYKDVVPEGKTMRDLSAEHVFAYGADDPFVTAHLYDLFKLIMHCEGTWDFVRDNEFPSRYPVSDGYLAGVEIDWSELDRQGKEDAEVYQQSMAKLRGLLEQNQTPELIAQGAQILLDEDAVVMTAEGESGKFPVDELPGRLDAAQLRAELRAQYTPFRREVKPIDFKLTPAQLTKVARLLGLPDVEKTTNVALSSYAAQAQGVLHTTEAERFVELLGQVKSRNEHEQQQVIDFCTRILQADPGAKTETTGDELNINSPKQMCDLLYGKLAFPIRVRNFEVSQGRRDLGLTEGGPQANEVAIETAIATDTQEGDWRREALKALLAARKADTRGKNFYRKYPLWRHPLTGRIHPHINSAGTETRRPTGSNPNPFQWPKKGDGVKFRRCILPNAALGHDLVVSVDWDQEELRLAAGLSRDPEMLSCYIGSDSAHLLPPCVHELCSQDQVEKWLEGKTRDMHSLTGAGMANMSYEEFARAAKDGNDPNHKRLSDIRKIAKNVNFASAYGAGAAKLSRQLMVTKEKAQEALDAKKSLYSRFEEWKQEVIAEARTKGYVTTLYGSRRHVYSEINSEDSDARSACERQLVNFLIQGVAADILKRVLAKMHREGTLPRHSAVLIAPIYDEVVMSIHSSNVVSLIRETHTMMTEHVPGLPVPILSSISLGANFGDQIELGTNPTDEVIWAAVSKALQVKEAA